VTLAHYWAARERLIQSRATHLDQLTDKLREPRVHRVIAPLLAGGQALWDPYPASTTSSTWRTPAWWRCGPRCVQPTGLPRMEHRLAPPQRP
jgi:hypothetical protein